MLEIIVGIVPSAIRGLSVLGRWLRQRLGPPPVWTELDVNPHYAPSFGALATIASINRSGTMNRSELTYLSGMPITISIGNAGVGPNARAAHVLEITMQVVNYVPLTEHAAEQSTLVALQTVQAGGRGSEYNFNVRLSVPASTSLPLLTYARHDNPESPTYLTISPDDFIEVTLQITARHPGRYLMAIDLMIQWGSRKASVKVREPIRIVESSNVDWIEHMVSVYEPTGDVHDGSVQAAHETWDEWYRLKEPLVLPDVEGRKVRVHSSYDLL